MTLTPDEREAAIEVMARAIAGCQAEIGADKWRYCLPEARAALDSVLPLIERAALLRAAEVAKSEDAYCRKRAAEAEHISGYDTSMWMVCANTAGVIRDRLKALADEVRT